MDISAILLRNIDWFIPIILFFVGWYFGARTERRHLANLTADEAKYRHIRVSSERIHCPDDKPIFVTGNVVIAQDRFKLVMADLLSLLGKNLTVYESLLDRARREALVRAKSQADKAGCYAIYGLRFEMCEIDGGVEVLAYGTAVMSVGNPNVPPKLPKIN